MCKDNPGVRKLLNRSAIILGEGILAPPKYGAFRSKLRNDDHRQERENHQNHQDLHHGKSGDSIFFFAGWVKIHGGQRREQNRTGPLPRLDRSRHLPENHPGTPGPFNHYDQNDRPVTPPGQALHPIPTGDPSPPGFRSPEKRSPGASRRCRREPRHPSPPRRSARRRPMRPRRPG